MNKLYKDLLDEYNELFPSIVYENDCNLSLSDLKELEHNAWWMVAYDNIYNQEWINKGDVLNEYIPQIHHKIDYHCYRKEGPSLALPEVTGDVRESAGPLQSLLNQVFDGWELRKTSTVATNDETEDKKLTEKYKRMITMRGDPQD